MLAQVMELWTVHNARNAAMALLEPRVACSRRQLGSIPLGAWRDPYIIGFITTLATLLARRHADGLGNTGLALVQSQVWARLSGEPDAMIGSEIMLLSLADEPDFADGCRAGREFLSGLPLDELLVTSTHLNAGWWDSGMPGSAALADRWPDYFDRRIERYCRPFCAGS